MSRVILARDIQSHRTLRLEWGTDRQWNSTWTSELPHEGYFVAPGLVDLQVNGFSGIDFQSEAPISIDALVHACQELRRAGCLHFLLTVITDEWDALLNRLRHLRAMRAKHPLLRQMIVGWHVEGPFLSDRPGFHGAHNPTLMRDPSPALISDLHKVLANDSVLITLAPERPGAIDSITLATALGFRVSLGHTDASSTCLADAIAAGASGFTHLGNGCPQLLDRHDNILWRVLDQPRLKIGLIPDGHHLPESPFRVIHRAAGTERIFYVSDAMSAAGGLPGRYPLKDQMLEVGVDGIVRRPGSQQFAGSALRPVDGVFRAAAVLKESWEATWRRFSTAPAQWMFAGMESNPITPHEQCMVQVNTSGDLEEMIVVGCPQD